MHDDSFSQTFWRVLRSVLLAAHWNAHDLTDEMSHDATGATVKHLASRMVRFRRPGRETEMLSSPLVEPDLAAYCVAAKIHERIAGGAQVSASP